MEKENPLSDMRRLKWILPLCILFGIAALLPRCASIPFVRQTAVKWTASALGVDLEADHMHLSWFGPQEFSGLRIKTEELSASIQNLDVEIPLWRLPKIFHLQGLEKIKGNAQLEGGSIAFAIDPPIEISQVDASLRIERGSLELNSSGTTAQDNQMGSFSITGRLQDIADPLLGLSIRANLQSVPSLFLSYFLQKKTKLKPETVLQSLGSFMSGNASAAIENGDGPIDLSLRASNASADIQATISEGAVALRSPLTASVNLTPELSRTLLRRMNPLFITAVRSEKPVSLRIEPNGFSCPVFPLRLKEMEIGEGTLDLGRISCQNGSSLAMIASVLKSAPLSRTQTMPVWFTPLIFSYQKGILHPKRLDALVADQFHICIFGTIDIAKDRIDMVLGLTTDALYRAFKIEGLSENAVVAIPINGSTNHPEFVTGPAIARIAALMTAQAIPRGKFPGRVLKIFAQPDTQPPPPSTVPFPWERTK